MRRSALASFVACVSKSAFAHFDASLSRKAFGYVFSRLILIPFNKKSKYVKNKDGKIRQIVGRKIREFVNSHCQSGLAQIQGKNCPPRTRPVG